MSETLRTHVCRAAVEFVKKIKCENTESQLCSSSCSYLRGDEESFCASDTAGCDEPLTLKEQSCDESTPSLYVIRSPHHFKFIRENPTEESVSGSLMIAAGL